MINRKKLTGFQLILAMTFIVLLSIYIYGEIDKIGSDPAWDGPNVAGAGNIEAELGKLYWPPKIGKGYPTDIDFYDQSGKNVRISDFRGKALFIEYVGMNCPACQAYSGGNKRNIGAYGNNEVAQGVLTIDEIFDQGYAGGIKLSDPRLVYIAILLYDMNMGQPTKEDARKWAAHFKLDKYKQKYVLAPARDMRSQASYNLIPGFQLVDKNLILRSDSTGHYPQEDLYGKLLPMIPKILEE